MNPMGFQASNQDFQGRTRTQGPRLVARALRLVLAALGLAAALQAQDRPERITVQLNWQHQFQFAGYYAAPKKGDYREAGLEVDLVAAGGAKEPVKEVTSRLQHITETYRDIGLLPPPSSRT